MESGPVFTIYDLEADDLILKPAKKVPLWKLLFQASGVFVVITLIVFSIANYQYIQSQLIDWRSGEDGIEGQNKDSDGDGIPDWWEKKYLLDILDPRDSSKDIDNDNFSNYQEYQFGTNPRNPDTDGDKYTDGEEYKNGYNPNGVGRIDSDHDGIHDWWEELNGLNKKDPSDAQKDFDLDQLTNSREYELGTNPRAKDSDSDGIDDKDEVDRGLNPAGDGKLVEGGLANEMDTDNDKLDNDLENLYGTDPNNRDTDLDGYDDYFELHRGYDPSGSGMVDARIEIPALGIDSPLIWSQSEEEKEILNDLKDGTIHYPGSAFPGMRGNVYITGHSSYYSWSKSNYKEIFKDLGDLKIGDEIIFHIKLKNKKEVVIIYSMTSSEVVEANDPRLFRDYEGHELTLVTCWPVGTNLRRLMIKGTLKQPKLGR